MIREIDADDRCPLQARRGGRGDSEFLQTDDDLLVQGVERGAVEPCPGIAEAADVEGDGRHQFEARVGRHLLRQIRRLLTIFRDRRAEALRAETGDLGPDLKGTEAPRKLRPVFHRPGIARGEAARGGLEIVRPVGEGVAVVRLVAHEHAARVIVHMQPFVEIEGERIGTRDGGEAAGKLGHQGAKRTEGAVDMEPEVLGGGDVGKLRERISGAGIHRARRADEDEGLQARRAVRRNRGAQGGSVHLVPVVDGNTAQRVRAEAENVEGAGIAGMGLGRGVADKARVCEAARAAGKFEAHVAGDLQGDDGGERSAGDDEAAGRFRKAEEFAAPADHLPLDINGAMIAPAGIGVDRGGGDFGEQVLGRAGAVHPAEEARMRIAGAVRQERGELCGERRFVLAGLRQRLVKRRLHAGRKGRPHPALPGGLHLVHRGVEQRMRGRTERGPVLRVEPGVRIVCHRSVFREDY